MLKTNLSTYEIWDGDEILVDGLTFAEAAEQCLVYQEFFGSEVFVALRQSTRIIKHTTEAQEFKSAWIAYWEEIHALGNLH